MHQVYEHYLHKPKSDLWDLRLLGKIFQDIQVHVSCPNGQFQHLRVKKCSEVSNVF